MDYLKHPFKEVSGSSCIPEEELQVCIVSMTSTKSMWLHRMLIIRGRSKQFFSNKYRIFTVQRIIRTSKEKMGKVLKSIAAGFTLETRDNK